MSEHDYQVLCWGVGAYLPISDSFDFKSFQRMNAMECCYWPSNKKDQVRFFRLLFRRLYFCLVTCDAQTTNHQQVDDLKFLVPAPSTRISHLEIDILVHPTNREWVCRQGRKNNAVRYLIPGPFWTGLP